MIERVEKLENKSDGIGLNFLSNLFLRYVQILYGWVFVMDLTRGLIGLFKLLELGCDVPIYRIVVSG